MTKNYIKIWLSVCTSKKALEYSQEPQAAMFNAKTQNIFITIILPQLPTLSKAGVSIKISKWADIFLKTFWY